MEKTEKFSLFEALVEDAIGEVATKGIDKCSSKKVTLACFGLLAYNGIDSLATEMKETRNAVNKFVRKFLWCSIPIMFSFLLAVILALVII